MIRLQRFGEKHWKSKQKTIQNKLDTNVYTGKKVLVKVFIHRNTFFNKYDNLFKVVKKLNNNLYLINRHRKREINGYYNTFSTNY